MSGFEVLKALRLAKDANPGPDPVRQRHVEAKVKGFGLRRRRLYDEALPQATSWSPAFRPIIRRSKGHSQSVITTGRITVNLDAKTVEVDGPACT
jgi:two-component system cell cycle response regulator CtrA